MRTGSPKIRVNYWRRTLLQPLAISRSRRGEDSPAGQVARSAHAVMPVAPKAHRAGTGWHSVAFQATGRRLMVSRNPQWKVSGFVCSGQQISMNSCWNGCDLKWARHGLCRPRLLSCGAATESSPRRESWVWRADGQAPAGLEKVRADVPGSRHRLPSNAPPVLATGIPPRCAP